MKNSKNTYGDYTPEERKDICTDYITGEKTEKELKEKMYGQSLNKIVKEEVPENVTELKMKYEVLEKAFEISQKTISNLKEANSELNSALDHKNATIDCLLKANKDYEISEDELSKSKEKNKEAEKQRNTLENMNFKFYLGM